MFEIEPLKCRECESLADLFQDTRRIQQELIQSLSLPAHLVNVATWPGSAPTPAGSSSAEPASRAPGG